MSLTSANATALVRSLIKEPTAKFWTDAEITLYLTGAMQQVWGKYAPWLYALKKSWVDGPIVSGNATCSPTYTPALYRISKLLVKEDGRKLQYVHDDEIWNYAAYDPGNPSAWTYKAGAINLFPTPSSSDADYLSIYYLPAFTDITSFPDALQMLVVVVAVIYGKSKDEDVTQDLLDLRKWHEEIAALDMEMATMGQVEVFPDFCEEDTLC